MATKRKLRPAKQLAKHRRPYPNESREYGRARANLLAEEIELRRQIERVAAQRRTLPPGGEVPADYLFEGENGPVKLSEMFGKHKTLIVYNYMYGPHRKLPCPMCTSLLSSWDGEAADIEQRVALAVVAKSPIKRLKEFKRKRGWRHLKLYSSGGNSFNRDYLAEGPQGEDYPAFNVFIKRNGKIRHFWGGEMTMEMADPGQDPRGAPDLMPIWTILDSTPEGRGRDWYPKLTYGASAK